MHLDAISGCSLNLTPAILSAVRDRSLSAEEMARITQHIAECPACGARLEQYELLARTLRTLEAPQGARKAPINPRLISHRANRRRRLRMVYPSGLTALIAALILIGLAGLIPVLGPKRPATATVTPTSVARVSATIDLRARPTGAGAGPWFLDSTDHLLAEIDVVSNEVVQAYPAPDDASLLTMAAGSLWLARGATGDVERLDPISGRTLASIALHQPLRGGIAVSPGAVWVASGKANTVWRIDTTTNRVGAAISVGEFPRMLDVGDGALWVCEGHDKLGVWRIDLSSNQVVAKIDISEGRQTQCAGIAIDPNGAVWALNRDNDPRSLSTQSELLRIDPATNHIISVVPVGEGMNNPFAATDDAIWVASYQHQALYRVDSHMGRLMGSISLPDAPNSISLQFGELWAQSGVAQGDGSIAPGRLVWRIQPA